MPRAREALFGGLLYGVMDVEEPDGWVRLQAVLAVPDEFEGQIFVVRCLDVSATDEAGVVLDLSIEEAAEFGRRFVDAYQRGRGRGFQSPG